MIEKIVQEYKEDFPTLDSIEECPACGLSRNAHICPACERWHGDEEGEFTMIYIGVDSLMMRQCTRCSYRWYEIPLNYQSRKDWEKKVNGRK